MNTKDKGNISEIMAIAAFMAKGVSVSIPYGENSRYDLVVEIDGELKKVQVKTGRLSEDQTVLLFNVKSTYHNMDGSLVSKHYKSDIDMFAVYVSKLNKLYTLNIKDVNSESDCTLRLADTKNNQSKGIKWASDYEYHNFNI